MKKAILSLFAVPFILAPVAILAQGMASKGATYITDEEVKQVNALPGIDRTIRVVDIGPENFAVGIIHRGATGRGARSGSGGRRCGRRRARSRRGGGRRRWRGRGTRSGSGSRTVRRAVDGASDRRHAGRASPTISRPKAT